jgi:branched-chain amino acid transport system substrate-binding protein
MVENLIAIVGDVDVKNAINSLSLNKPKKLPVIMPASTECGNEKDNDYFFRTCFSDDFQGSACAIFCKNELKAKTASILIEDKSGYSKNLATAFQKTFEAKGGIVTTVHKFKTGNKDFRSQLNIIKTNNSDVIFIPVNYDDAVVIAKQVKELNIKAPLIGGSEWQSKFTPDIDNRTLNGSYFSTHFSMLENRPSVDQFAKAFRAKYNKGPDAFAALGYDSMWLLAEAIKKAGVTDGGAISKALAQTADYPGVTGRITINGQKTTIKPTIIVKVKRGSLVPVVSISPEQIK